MAAWMRELYLMPEADALKADASKGSKPGAQAPHGGVWTPLLPVAKVSPEVLQAMNQ